MKKYEKILDDNRKKQAQFIFLAGLAILFLALSEVLVYFEEKNNGSLGQFESIKIVFSFVFVFVIGVFAIVFSIYSYKKKPGKKYDRLYKMAYIIDHGETIFENEYIKIVDSIIINKTYVENIAYLDEIYFIKTDESGHYQGGSHSAIHVFYHIAGEKRKRGFTINVGYVPLEVANKLADIIKSYCPFFNGESAKKINSKYENNSYEEVFGDNHYIPSMEIRQKAYKDYLMIEKKFEKVEVRAIDVMKAASKTDWMAILWIVELGGVLLIFDMFWKKNFKMINLLIYISFAVIPIIVYVITCIITYKKVKGIKL